MTQIIFDPIIEKIKKELIDIYKCHTIILFGSRSRNDFNENSDYDIAGFANINKEIRTCRLDEEYLDIVIYPDHNIIPLNEKFLILKDGIIIYEKGNFGSDLLSAINHYAKTKPTNLSINEINSKRIWYNKMLDRANKKDLHGKFRYLNTISSLLEDYFIFRNMRFLGIGIKKGLEYLKNNDKECYILFDKAISNTDDINALRRLIEKVIY